jgi:hypothetical protein
LLFLFASRSLTLRPAFWRRSGRTAEESFQALTSLLEKHGQGGATLNATDPHVHSTHNIWIIADNKQCYVVEGVRKEWVAQKFVSGVVAVSNISRIGDKWDFGTAHSASFCLVFCCHSCP